MAARPRPSRPAASRSAGDGPGPAPAAWMPRCSERSRAAKSYIGRDEQHAAGHQEPRREARRQPQHQGRGAPPAAIGDA